MKVESILKNKGGEIISVSPTDSVMHAVEVLCKYKVGALMVREASGAIAGVLSERDVARNLPEFGGDLLDKHVSSIMTANVITCDVHDDIAEVMEVMTSKKIRHLPVLEDGKLVGVISIGDVVKLKIAEAEAEAEVLKQYISAG